MEQLQIAPDHVYQTSDFLKHSRLEEWRSSMAAAYYAIDIIEDSGAALDAKIEVVTLSNVNISKFRSTTARGFRTRSNIARDSTEYFVFVFVTDGEMFFNQLARCGTLKAGHYVMLRSGEPYELSCLRPSRAFTVHLPIVDIEERYRLAHLHCAKAFESEAALFPMAAAVISSIGSVPPASRKFLCQDLRHQVIDIILLLLRAERIHTRAHGSTGSEGLFLRLIGHIERHYMNTELSARSAAEDIGVSVSHLHRVFQGYNLTFGSALRDTRLKHSYELLSSSEGSACNISDIAYRIGFLDHSHFSKSFKAAFGVSPTEVQNGIGHRS
jgi:AraC-like DNA-binding protein